eukprot:TRINITY_DN221_c0_g1_i1.p1 TRINITY_DN221_c0_g1~~TRINITY_DN221_c0_g1_i1.p1  ORF type:complete len:488 (-),score=79.60 TRINITY_DN221_c0_g1_i1:72-1535(-)
MIIFLSILLVLVVVVFATLEWYLELKRFEIPGPKGIPILYCLPQVIMMKSQIYDFVFNNVMTYGKTTSVRLPLIPRIVLVVEPECVDYILRANFDNYIKGPQLTERLDIFLGDGIFNTNGRQWKVQRQIASHMFTNNGLKEMAQVFLRHGEEVVSLLLDVPYSKTKVMEMQKLFCQFTLDSIGEIAFGTNIDSLHKPEFPFAQAFDDTTYCLDHRFANPLWKYSGWTPFERKLRKAISILDAFAAQIIKERRADPNLSTNKDILSQHLQIEDSEIPITDKYLRDVILNFMIAGRDTTSQTLLWTFYLLAQNSDVEKKLIDEVDTILKDEKPSYENVKNLKYLQSVIDESLRLYPPVPIDQKYSVEDDVLPNGYKIKAGTIVEWSAWVNGRHPDFWEEPLLFKPERWSGPEHNGGKPVPNRVPPFIPFQFGPRLCLGMNMAYLEVKIMICLILQKMTLRLAPDQKVRYLPTITISAKDGIVMTVHPRT